MYGADCKRRFSHAKKDTDINAYAHHRQHFIHFLLNPLASEHGGMGIAHRWCSVECDELGRIDDYWRQKDKGIIKSCFEVKSASKQLF